MSEEQKAVEEKVEETTNQPAATGETKDDGVKDDKADKPAGDQAPGDEIKASGDDGIDWAKELAAKETELAKSNEDRDNYRDGMLNAKDKLEKSKKPKEDIRETDVVSQVSEIVSKQVEGLRKDFSEDTLDTMISSLANNPDKQAVIRFHYENTIKQTGASKTDIRRDLANALAIADNAQIRKENDEIKTSIKNREGMGASGGQGGNQVKSGDNVDVSTVISALSRADKSVMERMASRKGITFEEVVKENMDTLN